MISRLGEVLGYPHGFAPQPAAPAEDSLMRPTPRSNSRLLLSCFAAAVLMAAASVTPNSAVARERGPQLDLIGTWFVLTHYKDSKTANPDADRWEDKVWVFEKKGSRLRWVEYPIVVFKDSTGRFETLGRNPRARTLEAWTPNAGQWLQIVEGPRVNSRGAKSKSLRGSLERGYKSFGQLRASSASVIGYQEIWSVERPATQPVFIQTDLLGTGRSRRAGGATQQMEGITRYQTLEISEDADTLSGVYQRDENRVGVFKMMRAGPVRGLESDGRTPNQKAADRVREAVLEEVDRRVNEGDPEMIRELREALRNAEDRRP